MFHLTASIIDSRSLRQSVIRLTDIKPIVRPTDIKAIAMLIKAMVVKAIAMSIKATLVKAMAIIFLWTHFYCRHAIYISVTV